MYRHNYKKKSLFSQPLLFLIQSYFKFFHGIIAYLSSRQILLSCLLPLLLIPYTPPNNLPQFVQVKLEGPSSYLNWSSQVEDALNIHDLWCFVDGTETCPNEFLPISEGGTREINPDFTLWNRKNRFVLVWMKSTISDKVLLMVYGLKTARQAWVALAQHFASPSISNVNQLK